MIPMIWIQTLSEKVQENPPNDSKSYTSHTSSEGNGTWIHRGHCDFANSVVECCIFSHYQVSIEKSQFSGVIQTKVPTSSSRFPVSTGPVNHVLLVKREGLVTTIYHQLPAASRGSLKPLY